MIPACWDKISIRPAETDFTLRLHVKINFRPGKVGQFSNWYLIRFASIFFWIFLCKHLILQNLLKFFFLELFSLQLCLLRSSRSQMFFRIGVRKNFTVFT